jgi:hypothetical protein
MKKFLPLLGILLLSGCATLKQQNADSVVNSVVVGQESNAGIGDTFFTNETITGNEAIMSNGMVEYDWIYGSANKMELTVAGATNEKLILNYAEYTKPPSPFDGDYPRFLKNDPWLIKSGFNSQFQYDLTTSKTVTFKGFEFQVLGVQNNTVTYKRTK